MSTNISSPGIVAGAAHLAAIAGRALEAAWAALSAGSRAIPLGDNGSLYRELAARAAAANRCK
jgi:hypothetical protein